MRIPRPHRLCATMARLVAPALFIGTAMGADPALTAGGGSTPTFLSGGSAVTVDGGLQVVSSTALTGARIQINDFVTGDVLAATVTGSISASWNATTGVLTLSGSGSAAEYQQVLRSVTLSASTVDDKNRSITFTLGDAIPLNGHYYEYVGTTAQPWTTAKSLAEARTLFGMQGYLATITSAEESTFITARLQSNAWIGASDAASEGDWRWVTGPEGTANGNTGTPFWSGAAGGSAVSSAFTNWNASEPNDSGGIEDYAEIYFFGAGDSRNGRWNDLRLNGFTDFPGYLVEYGGMVGDPTLQISSSASVAVNTLPTISGTPATTVAEDSSYSFTPTGGDVDAGTTDRKSVA
jgi:hypothetical protein